MLVKSDAFLPYAVMSQATLIHFNIVFASLGTILQLKQANR